MRDSAGCVGLAAICDSASVAAGCAVFASLASGDISVRVMLAGSMVESAISFRKLELATRTAERFSALAGRTLITASDANHKTAGASAPSAAMARIRMGVTESENRTGAA